MHLNTLYYLELLELKVEQVGARVDDAQLTVDIKCTSLLEHAGLTLC